MNHASRAEARSSAASQTSPVLVAGLVLLAALAVGMPRSQAAERSGKEIVDAVCSSCHGTGANGAPRIGDEQAWSKRAKEGLSGLTRHALEGIRKMPSHGGNPTLTDFEIKRAVAYMVNQSGGHWTEPIDKAHPPATRSGEQIVKMRCIKCHEKGINGAPKIGDRDAWLPRLKNGLDATVRSAINGHGGMPARGGMANITDAEMREAVIYMVNKGRVPENPGK